MMNLVELGLASGRALMSALSPVAEFDVSGRVVLITGGADGIGLALARELKSRGASIAIVDRNTENLQKAAMELGGEVMALEADVRDRDVMAKHVADVLGHFGRLDVVIANAGVAPDPYTVRTIASDEFDRIIDINLIGVLNTVKPAIEPIIESRGHIVVVASAAAFMPGMGLAAYMVSKAGAEQLGRALQIELAAHGASAGVAYFGFVQTELARPLDEDELLRECDARIPFPLRRRISAEQAATAVANGIAQRTGTIVAPGAWTPVAVLRGLVGPAAARYLAQDSWTHNMIRRVEHRVEEGEEQ